LTLPLVEFAYNNAVNTTTGKSPLEIVHGYSPRTLLTSFPSHQMPACHILHPHSHSIFMTCMFRFDTRLL